MLNVLFLDFDGVLHPRYEDGPTPKEICFCHLPLFESVMRQSSETHIVISSTWRLTFGLDRLRSFFSQDIAKQIIDVTPQYPIDGPPLVAQREWEIVRWLTIHHHTNCQWAALDDATYEFSTCRSNVIGCRSWEGFTERVAEALHSRLK